jgi:sensor histidine kinase YesM
MKTNFKTALILSAAISLLLNAIYFMSFFYAREIPPGGALRHLPVFDPQKTAVNIVSNFALMFILYMLIFTLFRTKLKNRLQLLIIIVSSAVLTYFLSTLVSGLQVNWFNFEYRSKAVKGFLRGSLYRDYMIAVLVILSSQLIRIFIKQQKTELEKNTLQAEYMRSRYEALKNQVDPHFLFNSLNTLNSLVNEEKAREYVQQLSLVFRYTLQNKEIISLRDELDFTRAYCNLMKIRYGDDLNFEISVSEKLYDYLIIPLSLQTLVENAIKHNVVCQKHPLKVTVKDVNESIKVSNPVQPKKEPESGAGIGLMNLAERYRLMWNREISIIKTDTVFEVTIPIMPR